MQIRIIALAAALVASGAQAATVDWRQGSGNSGDFFTVTSGTADVANGTGTLTLGLRAVQRNVGTITPVGNVYHANAGPGAQPNRAWWNFDIYAGFTDMVSPNGFVAADTVRLDALSSLTLQINSYGGSTPGAASFNLLDAGLRGAIDCHVTGCVNGSEFNQDATLLDADPNLQNAKQYFNSSQNATFAPWFNSFNFLLPAFYDFTLTAMDATGQTLTTTMRVNVGNYVPEPGSFALAGLALLGLVGARRRQARLSA